MTELRKRTHDYMVVKGYAPITRRNYLNQLKHYALYFNSCPSQLGEKEMIEYLRYLSEEKGLSRASINQVYSALKILYANVLERPWNPIRLPRPRGEKRLPQVLSLEEVSRLIDLTVNLKHRCLLMLIYSAGLRVGEVSRVRWEHIEWDLKRIFIQSGKRE